MAIATLEHAPKNAHITVRVTPKSGLGRFGLCLRGSGEYADGCELQFDLANRCVQFSRPKDGMPGDGTSARITDVDEITEPFSLELVADGHIIHACIGNRRTLAVRDASEGSRLFFFAQGCEAVFDSIRICPLC